MYLFLLSLLFLICLQPKLMGIVADFSFICAGADFNNVTFTIEVPAETTSLRITNITIVNDNINEIEEIYVLVARILGQAADVACFQIAGTGPCYKNGHIGGTQLRIRNDDGR